MAIDWDKDIDFKEVWKKFKSKFYSKTTVSQTIIGNNNVQSGMTTDGDMFVHTEGNNIVTTIVGRRAKINGKTYDVNGGNLQVINGRVYIDGEHATAREDKEFYGSFKSLGSVSSLRRKLKNKRLRRKRARRKLMIFTFQLVFLLFFGMLLAKVLAPAIKARMAVTATVEKVEEGATKINGVYDVTSESTEEAIKMIDEFTLSETMDSAGDQIAEVFTNIDIELTVEDKEALNEAMKDLKEAGKELKKLFD